MRRHLTTYIILAFVLFVSACSQQNGSVRPTSSRSVDQAILNYQNGNYFVAIPVLESAFAKDPQRQDIGIMLLDSLIQTAQYPQAWQVLSRNQLEDSFKLGVLQAELLASSNEYIQALQKIDALKLEYTDSMVLPQPWLIRSLRLAQQLYSESNQHLDSALIAIELSELLPEENMSDTIVNELLLVSDFSLKQSLDNSNYSNLVLGWLEAAYIDFGADGETGEEWYKRWFDHPASSYFFDSNTSSSFRNIAFLLPLSGRFESAGKAIQQGVLAASFDYLESDSRIRFYDTGSDGEYFSSVWYSAQEAAADIIVGPLEKKSLALLEQFAPPTVPVLLLNQSTLGSYYQFTLSPENEAKIVAENMLAEGKRRALVIAPRDEWGQRLGQAFIDRFIEGGGIVINQSYYTEAESDFSPQLRQALGLIESQLRSQKLQQMLKRQLESAEKVHTDLDAIFLAAKPQFARLMVPQLKFHHAGNVPVYATSHIYSGRPNANLDRDLSGVKLTVSPFEIGYGEYTETLNFESSSIHVDKRLFAFGYDAALLVSRLNWLQGFPGGKINGLSGDLLIDFDGSVRRQLPLATFVNGVPELTQ